jgi:hypothetical protein
LRLQRLVVEKFFDAVHEAGSIAPLISKKNSAEKIVYEILVGTRQRDVAVERDEPEVSKRINLTIPQRL